MTLACLTKTSYATIWFLLTKVIFNNNKANRQQRNFGEFFIYHQLIKYSSKIKMCLNHLCQISQPLKY